MFYDISNTINKVRTTQILPTVAFLFFFRTDSTDSPDCLPILLSIAVFLLFTFSVFHFVVEAKAIANDVNDEVVVRRDIFS